MRFLLAPFAGSSHCIPFVELGRRLIDAGHQVSLLIPDAQVVELRRRQIIKPEDAFHTRDVAYRRPEESVSVAKLIDGTVNILSLLNEMLQSQVPVTAAAISDIITDDDKDDRKSSAETVDVVIIDWYLSPAATVCKDHGTPFFVFNTGAPLMAVSLLTITEDTPSDVTATTLPTLRTFASKYTLVPATMKTMTLLRRSVLASSGGLILNSFTGLTDDIVESLRQEPFLLDVPIYQVGPLFEANPASVAADPSGELVRRWLDKQAANSVVYLSFGTVVAPSLLQLTELAKAALKLGRPFIWSLEAHFYSHLPELSRGFPVEASPDSPFLVMPWTPQRAILRHPSLAVFASHCSWNSTLEGIAAGVPFLCWPMFSDQFLNAEWIEDIGAGVMVKGTGTEAKRVVPADEVVESIERVRDGTFASAAQRWKRIIAHCTTHNGSYHTEFSGFLANTESSLHRRQ